MTRRRLLWLLLVVSLGCLTAAAQDDCRRRWSINLGGSPFAQPVQTGSYPRAIIVTQGTEWFVTGEVALPDKWAAEAGYYHTEIVYDDRARRMQGLRLGMKRYFLPDRFPVQPFLAASAWGNFDERVRRTTAPYLDSHATYYFRNPRLSLSPGIGLDFYLLSSVALTLRYDFVIGLDARTAIDQPGSSIDMGSNYADRGMYHDLSVGLKVNFPFCFREDDAWTLFYMVLDNIFY